MHVVLRPVVSSSTPFCSDTRLMPGVLDTKGLRAPPSPPPVDSYSPPTIPGPLGHPVTHPLTYIPGNTPLLVLILVKTLAHSLPVRVQDYFSRFYQPPVPSHPTPPHPTPSSGGGKRLSYPTGRRAGGIKDSSQILPARGSASRYIDSTTGRTALPAPLEAVRFF